jgi:hypothetical protein
MDDLTPAQLNERASKLRSAARRARAMAESLGGYLSGAHETASQRDPQIWRGPYADATTGEIGQHHRTLRDMASALQGDASRWDREAENMEQQAAKGD